LSDLSLAEEVARAPGIPTREMVLLQNFNFSGEVAGGSETRLRIGCNSGTATEGTALDLSKRTPPGKSQARVVAFHGSDRRPQTFHRLLTSVLTKQEWPLDVSCLELKQPTTAAATSFAPQLALGCLALLYAILGRFSCLSKTSRRGYSRLRRRR
jgi:hypothetical protein